MQTVMIDTDIAIDFLRGVAEAKDLIIPLWERGAAFLSLLTVYELYAGMQPKEQEVTDYFMRACRIESLTVEITKRASENYQHYRKQGITLTTIDCLIWATAKVNKHKIATRNLRHYPDKSILLLK
ncbi:MAG: type II toxin-antitoxin system VapC family toxin [Gammaproteobacteria bacterium]|nr:MAG: type II toxin-antitoxin system VapC family toxin [Gammaproteobacteria bacterium]